MNPLRPLDEPYELELSGAAGSAVKEVVRIPRIQ